MIRRPPSATRSDTLFPYTTLCRSIFMSALVLTAAGNAYARWAQRPGALVRVPGIILMVPGSASVRSVLTLIQQQDLAAGQQAALAVVNILLALIAGLL